MATKKIIEKKTGEKYASKAAMMKHEKGESKAEMKKEYGKVKPATKQMKSPMQMKSPAYMKMADKMKAVDKKAAPTKMKKC